MGAAACADAPFAGTRPNRRSAFEGANALAREHLADVEAVNRLLDVETSQPEEDCDRVVRVHVLIAVSVRPDEPDVGSDAGARAEALLRELREELAARRASHARQRPRCSRCRLGGGCRTRSVGGLATQLSLLCRSASHFQLASR